MFRFAAAAGLLFASLVGAPAMATGLYWYRFEALSTSNGITGNFNYFTSAFVVPGTLDDPFLVSPDMQSGCTALDESFNLLPCGTHELFSFSDYDVAGFSYRPDGLGQVTLYFYFAPGALTTVGVYETLVFGSDRAGRLLVSFERGGGGGTPGIPEPATWAMLIAGFGLVGSALRRRRRLARTAG